MSSAVTGGRSVVVEVVPHASAGSVVADPGVADPALAHPALAHPAVAETSASPSPRSRPRWWFELGFVVVLDLMYEMIRNEAPDQVALAVANARSILRVESIVGLNVESGINSLFASHTWLAIPANYYYSTLHMVVAIAVLVWLYVSRPAHYRRSRSVLLAMTLTALLGYWLFPLAPPRLTPGFGFVDTVRVFNTWGVSSSAPLVSASNQYAAMPSMHVGWALWSGVMLARYADKRWLWALGVSYPVVTFVVVVATANHFVLDAVVAAVVFVASFGVVDLVGRATRAG